MLDKKMEEQLNKQVTAEFYSGYLYLSMAAYFEDKNLAGFANWMEIQAKEELDHGMKIYGYINRKGGKAIMEAIDKPDIDWESNVALFEQVLSHEETVTGMINDLVDLSIELKDHATTQFLQWFVEEQVEEEENASDILAKVKMAKDSAQLTYLLNEELATRVYTPLADEE